MQLQTGMLLLQVGLMQSEAGTWHNIAQDVLLQLGRQFIHDQHKQEEQRNKEKTNE
jgi:hypothetical protein